MSFSIVVGFFIGLIISIVKFNSPELIILGTIIGTAGFYLIITLGVSFFIQFSDFDRQKMNISKLDSTLDYYSHEFDRREKEVLGIRNYLKQSLKNLDNTQE